MKPKESDVTNAWISTTEGWCDRVRAQEDMSVWIRDRYGNWWPLHKAPGDIITMDEVDKDG